MIMAFTVGNIKTFVRSYYGYLLIELVEAIAASAAFAAAMVLSKFYDYHIMICRYCVFGY